MVDKHLETQEQSIKARKHQLFEADEPTAVGSGRPFKAFLRETPAAPLSGLTKMVLWAAGLVVALVLIAALAKTFHRHSQPAPRPVRKASVSAPAARVRGAAGRQAGPTVKICTGPRQPSPSTYVSA